MILNDFEVLKPRKTTLFKNDFDSPMYLVPVIKPKNLFIFEYLSRVLHTGDSGIQNSHENW